MKISVVIPCRNEKSYIEECIDAIFRCDLSPDAQLEVYVVDGMSEDGTREVIESCIKNHPNLYLVDNQQQLTPFAFNLGIYAGGKTDYVQIVGARHILSKNYLSTCLRILREKTDVWCVGGKIINEYINDNGRIISEVMSTPLGMGIGNFRTLESSGYTDTVTSPMYPYWVFEKIGFFDEALIRNQDDDFNYRVNKAGGKIYFEAGISLRYYVRGNFKGLWRQFYQYGYWKVFVNKKHSSVTTLRQLVPPVFVVYLLLSCLSIFLGATITLFFLIPLLVYILLVINESRNILNKIRDVKINYWKVMMTFPRLHLSYGLGYLKGIMDFIILNKKPSDKQKRLSR